MVGKVTPNTMLSASRLPAIMGFSKYRSPNDELQASIEAINGIDSTSAQNEAMQWGDTLERIIIEKAAERLGVTDLVTHHPEPRFHPLLPLACSIDAVANGNAIVVANDPDKGIMVMDGDIMQLTGVGIIEAKLTSVAPEHTPALYRGPIQLQAQMDITGAKWGALAVLYRGTELRIFLFKPHEPTLRAIDLTSGKQIGILNTIHLSTVTMPTEHGGLPKMSQFIWVVSLKRGRGTSTKPSKTSSNAKTS
jgi:hypothetical protein